RQGFQRQLFMALEEYAEQEKCDFLVLWSNQIEFYAKLGFFLGGLQASWFVEHRAAFGPQESKAVVLDSANFEMKDSHFESFHRKRCRVHRSYEEMKQLMKIPKMKIAYTAQAYAL